MSNSGCSHLILVMVLRTCQSPSPPHQGPARSGQTGLACRVACNAVTKEAKANFLDWGLLFCITRIWFWPNRFMSPKIQGSAGNREAGGQEFLWVLKYPVVKCVRENDFRKLTRSSAGGLCWDTSMLGPMLGCLLMLGPRETQLPCALHFASLAFSFLLSWKCHSPHWFLPPRS